jgi:hypothetical protein
MIVVSPTFLGEMASRPFRKARRFAREHPHIVAIWPVAMRCPRLFGPSGLCVPPRPVSDSRDFSGSYEAGITSASNRCELQPEVMV